MLTARQARFDGQFDLRSGDMVLMDDLSGHKRSSIRILIEVSGAGLRLLPL